MKTIMYAMGSLGDINPVLGVAVELARRGHDVTFLSNAHFRETIERCGIEFVAVGNLEEYEKGTSTAAWNTADSGQYSFANYHAPTFEPSYNYVRDLAAAGDKFIVISLIGLNGAIAAADEFNIPFVGIVLAPNIVPSADSPPAPMCWGRTRLLPRFVRRLVLPRLYKRDVRRYFQDEIFADYRATRQRLGCPLKAGTNPQAALKLGFFPEWYGMRAPDWPSDLKLVGFPLQDNVDMNARVEADNFIASHGSPIVFTMGTGVSDAESLFAIGRSVCESLGIPGLFVGGNAGSGALDGSRTCRHIKYVDFQHLLLKARAIVHHGGIGTLAQAVRAGIPQVIRPIKYDQHDNANRVAKLGLGTYLFPEHFNAASLQAALTRLLGAGVGATTLAKYAHDLRRSNAVSRACDHIEENAWKLSLIQQVSE